MIRIRGGSGLGDSLYLRPIVDFIIHSGQKVTVLSLFPDVFIGSAATVEPFRRDRVDLVAHYTAGKNNPTTTLWQDMCAQARVDVPLRFDWTVQNRALVDGLQARAAGRPMIVVHGGREPMGRRDGFGIELLPQRDAFRAALAVLEDCLLVQIGKAPQIYQLAVDVDLNGSTTVADLLDIATVCDGIVAQCSFCVPLAEVFNKPLLAVWSALGLVSANPFIKTVTPGKMLSGSKSRYVMDDQPTEWIQEAALAFREFLGSRGEDAGQDGCGGRQCAVGAG